MDIIKGILYCCNFSERYLFVIRFVVLIALLVFATYVHLYFGDYAARIALSGWSALDFTNWFLNTVNFANDYPGGAWSIGNSMLPYVYPLFEKVFGISADFVLPVMIFFEMLTFICGALFLASVIFNKLSTSSSVIISVALLLGFSLTSNLANFGAPFFHGQFYGFADGLRLLAIGLYFRSSYVLCVLIFFVAFLIHPVKAFFGMVFILSAHLYFINNIKIFLNLKLVASSSLLLFFSAVWAYFWLGVGQENVDAISQQDFFKYSSLFNSHWYPQDLGILDSRNRLYFTPFVSATLMSFLALVRSSISGRLSAQIFSGLLAMQLLSFIGLFVAWFELYPGLVKMSLQRASMLSLTVSLIVIVMQLDQDIREKRWLIVGLTISALLSVFLTRETWSLFSVCFLALFSGTKHSKYRLMLLFSFMCLGLLLIYQAICFDIGFTNWVSVKRWWYSAVTGLFLGFVCFWLDKKTSVADVFLERLLQPGTSALVVFLGITWAVDNRTLPAIYVTKGEAFRAAQVWAKQNTTETDVFVVDPCYAYGWRDYSSRSSFGTFQEWLKTGWLYTGDGVALQEGLKRAGLYANDKSDPVSRMLVNGERVSRGELCNFARSSYYDDGGELLKRIFEEFSVDYAVFDRAEWLNFSAGSKTLFPVVYENQSFLILKLI